jgi:vitamin B12 transporter
MFISKQFGWAFFATCLIFAVSASNLSAQDTTNTLNTIVVTTRLPSESLREVTSNVTIITEEDLQNAPGDTLESALRREGVHIMEYPGQGTSTIELRGIRNSLPAETGGLGNRALLLVDGRLAGTGNTSAIMKSNVARVEIIRGPAALVYGSQAMAGVINVVTKTGEGDFSAHLKAGLGSWSFSDQSVGIDGRASGVDYSFGFYHSRVGDFTDGEGVIAIGSDTKGLYSASFNLGYNFLDDHQRIGVIGRYFLNRWQGTGNGYSNTSKDGNIRLKNYSYDFLYTGASPDDIYSWQLRYYHVSDSYYSFNTTDRRSETPYYTVVDTNGIQAQFSIDTAITSLTGGIDWVKYDYIQGSTYTDGYFTEGNLSNIAGFLTGNLKLADDSFILSGAVRFDKFSSEASSKTASSDNSLDNWSVSVGAAYLPVEWLKLRANFAKGFRAPTISEMTMDYATTWGGHYVGNPDLQPEFNTSWEVGLDISTDFYLNISATLFNTHYTNQIYSVSAPWLGPGYYTYLNNTRDTKNTGVEATIDFDIGRYLGYDFSLTPYFKTTFYITRDGYFNTGIETTDITLRVPKVNFTYGVSFDYPEIGLNASINASYFGTMKDTFYDYNIYANHIIDTEPYTLVDIYISKTLINYDDQHKVTVEASVRNLLDKYYQGYPDYPSPGRSFYVALSYDFN